jgi:hypothetical protein
MALFLLEFATESTSRADVSSWLAGLADEVRKSGGSVVEAQIATDLKRTYVVVAHEDRAALERGLAGVRPPVRDVAPVRLVGATLEEVRAAARGPANYLVEWDLPAGLTMERYLSRKAEKTPLYAQVPEVKFLRTYVREDMARCLCFYDAPDPDAVRRAREAVGAPVNRLSSLEGPR